MNTRTILPILLLLGVFLGLAHSASPFGQAVLNPSVDHQVMGSNQNMSLDVVAVFEHLGPTIVPPSVVTIRLERWNGFLKTWVLVEEWSFSTPDSTTPGRPPDEWPSTVWWCNFTNLEPGEFQLTVTGDGPSSSPEPGPGFYQWRGDLP